MALFLWMGCLGILPAAAQSPTTGIYPSTAVMEEQTMTLSPGAGPTSATFPVSNPTCSTDKFGNSIHMGMGRKLGFIVPGDFKGEGKQHLFEANLFDEDAPMRLGGGAHPDFRSGWRFQR